MRVSIKDYILKQDAKLKEQKANIDALKELKNSSILLENEYQMCVFKIPLFVEDEYNSKIFTTPLYSLAKSVKIREDARIEGIVLAINYHRDMELRSGKQRVYCREEGWSDLDMRVAIVKTSEVRDNHGYGYVYEHVKHGPKVEELKKYYTYKGVDRELVEQMADLVSELRTKNPARSTWVG